MTGALADPGPSLAAEAAAWIGTPYAQRAALKGVGADCIGLPRGVYAAVCGIVVGDGALPTYSDDWAGAISAEPLLAEIRTRLREVDIDAPARPGDVLCFRCARRFAVQHVGICESVDEVGAPRTMIHALKRRGVCRVHLSNTWRPRLVAIFRI